MDTQTSYAVPLALGVFSEENIAFAVEHLVETCRRENRDDEGMIRPAYSLMTGFIGTPWISKALSDYGYQEIAYRMLQQTSYPSWLYPVEQGATTIWERLNSYTKRGWVWRQQLHELLQPLLFWSCWSLDDQLFAGDTKG